MARLLALRATAGAGERELQGALPADRSADSGGEHADRRSTTVHRGCGAVQAVLLPGMRWVDRERGVPVARPGAARHRATPVGRARSSPPTIALARTTSPSHDRVPGPQRF